MMEDPDIVIYQSNLYKPIIDKAIALTENYVSENKLVLTGGMAIDLALRTKDQSIYDDDAIPDYDIISDKNLEHANALAKILCNENIPDVNVINAVHITTVRVRVKNVVFLDATYVPTACIAKIPYLDVGHLRVVHPHYQLIDQRLSLAQLMMDTGVSLNVFNRLKKDTVRNALLRNAFPIETSTPEPKTKIVSIPLSLIQIDLVSMNDVVKDGIIYTGPACIAGAVGVSLMLAIHNHEPIQIEGDNLKITIPSECTPRYLSCDIDRAKTMVGPVQTKTRPLINLKPASIHGEDYEIADTYGARVGCNVVEITEGTRVCLASVDYLLMECLRDRVYVNEELYTTLYQRLIEATLSHQTDESSGPIWWPSVNTYGKVNLPEYRVFMLERIMNPSVMGELRPKNSYLQYPKCFARSDGFDGIGSHYFQIDGTEDNDIRHTNHQHIIDDFNDYVNREKNKSN